MTVNGKDPSTVTDGFHTMQELYDYRLAYNACLFNEWAERGKYDVHKSWRHSDGELCFGGGWLVVSAQTPYGQVANHYEEQHLGFVSCIGAGNRSSVGRSHTRCCTGKIIVYCTHGKEVTPWILSSGFGC